MRATPMPRPSLSRDVMVDCDRPTRALRVSAHPEAGLVVVSMWDGARCAATLRLRPDDVPDLLRALAAAALAADHPVAAAS